MRRRGGLAFSSACIVLLVSGCSPVVAMDPASGATDLGCAEIMVRLPDTVEDLPRRETDAQATAAWGDPATVLLTCGLSAQAPTARPCLTVGSVDWVIDDSNPSFTTSTTHGRLPVTQVVIDSSETGGQAILSDLEAAVASSPPDPAAAACT